jgi:hypothetical protein
MALVNYLESVLKRLEGYYHELGRALPAPLRTKIGSGMYFRHPQLSDSLLVYLKGVKLISTLNAALVLFRHGYTQEIGALCRMADDYCYEIMFLLNPLGGDGPSKDQVRMFESFFQEEFENPDNPLASPQDRETVPRRKINAAFGKIVSDELNPHDAQNVLATIHKTFSGYVHGAYPHIMEMYGGMPPRFHMDGMLGTPRVPEWERQLVTYVYRAIMSAELTSRKLAQSEAEKSIRSLLVEYEITLNCKPQEKAETTVQREKKRPSTP